MRSQQHVRHSALCLIIAACLGLVGCGGSGPQAETASCSIAQSELGPFSSDTTLGQSMSEEEARARMAQDNIISWVAVSAKGPWDDSWDTATSIVGPSIHVDLTWLDVNGTITGLYETGDEFDFEDLRVSRSFQGKIEHNEEPLYLPLQDVGTPANFDADCTITALEFGDPNSDKLLDVLFDTPTSS